MKPCCHVVSRLIRQAQLSQRRSRVISSSSTADAFAACTKPCVERCAVACCWRSHPAKPALEQGEQQHDHSQCHKPLLLCSEQCEQPCHGCSMMMKDVAGPHTHPSQRRNRANSSTITASAIEPCCCVERRAEACCWASQPASVGIGHTAARPQPGPRASAAV